MPESRHYVTCPNVKLCVTCPSPARVASSCDMPESRHRRHRVTCPKQHVLRIPIMVRRVQLAALHLHTSASPEGLTVTKAQSRLWLLILFSLHPCEDSLQRTLPRLGTKQEVVVRSAYSVEGSAEVHIAQATITHGPSKCRHQNAIGICRDDPTKRG